MAIYNYAASCPHPNFFFRIRYIKNTPETILE